MTVHATSQTRETHKHVGRYINWRSIASAVSQVVQRAVVQALSHLPITTSANPSSSATFISTTNSLLESPKAGKIYWNRILVYRRAQVHQKRQYGKGQQSRCAQWTKRKCMQNRRFSKHISYVAAWTSINPQETLARTTITQKKRKWPNTVYLLFKTRRVSRETQDDHVQASTLTYILRSGGQSGAHCRDGGCTWGGGRVSWCDWETPTALWTTWDMAEAIDLDIIWHVGKFPVSETEVVLWLVTCTCTDHVLSYMIVNHTY